MARRNLQLPAVPADAVKPRKALIFPVVPGLDLLPAMIAEIGGEILQFVPFGFRVRGEFPAVIQVFEDGEIAFELAAPGGRFGDLVHHLPQV